MKALVLFSGGLDSTTVLAHAVKEFGAEEVGAMFFDYGQRHKREKESAMKVVDYYPGVTFIQNSVDQVFNTFKNCALINNQMEVQKGPYEPHPNTEVPFRNGTLISIASAYAMAHNIPYVYTGIHKCDGAYSDTTPEFFDMMSVAVNLGTGKKVILRAPFVNGTKADVVTAAVELKAPAGLTWSCYEGGKEPCGKCGTCVDRAQAFSEAGFTDPAFVDKILIGE